MPTNLAAAVQRLSGESVHDVAVHYNSPEPARLGAQAFTRGGREIHLGPGHQRELPHEAWHASQQRRGQVQADRMIRGAAANVSARHEGEADRMGARAAGLARSDRAPAVDGRASAPGPVPGLFGDVVQAQGWLSRASSYVGQQASRLSAMVGARSQEFKERFDPRRSTWNPYFNYHNTGTGPLTAVLGANPGSEHAYEAAHHPGGGGFQYHTTERHGAEHTLPNLLMRTIPRGPVGHLNANSAMQNVVHPGAPIPAAPVSSKFATPAWHTYARNVAEDHVRGTLGAHMAFPAGAPPAAALSSKFYMSFPGSGPGVSVAAPVAGGGPPTAQSTDHVEVNVSHHAGQAWITKFHPVGAAGAATNAFAGGGGGNRTVPYNQVPWFSTSRVTTRRSGAGAGR